MYSARCNADSTLRLIELTAKRNYKKEKIEEYMAQPPQSSLSLYIFFSVVERNALLGIVISRFAM